MHALRAIVVNFEASKTDLVVLRSNNLSNELNAGDNYVSRSM